VGEHEGGLGGAAEADAAGDLASHFRGAVAELGDEGEADARIRAFGEIDEAEQAGGLGADEVVGLAEHAQEAIDGLVGAFGGEEPEGVEAAAEIAVSLAPAAAGGGQAGAEAAASADLQGFAADLRGAIFEGEQEVLGEQGVGVAVEGAQGGPAAALGGAALRAQGFGVEGGGVGPQGPGAAVGRVGEQQRGDEQEAEHAGSGGGARGECAV
jgi:hypothetical protein